MSAEWTLDGIKSTFNQRAQEATTKDEVRAAYEEASRSGQVAIGQVEA